MHKKLPLFFLSLVLVLIIINIQVNPVYATVIFAHGFEGGNFGVDPETGHTLTGTDVKSGSTATVVSTQKHHGTYSFQAYSLSTGWAEAYKDPLSSPLNTGYFRTYVRFANLPTTGNRVYFHVTELSSTRKVGVIARNNAGQLQWGLWYYNAAQLEAYVNSAISVDTWYSVEVKHLRHASAGEARLYVDGSEIITQTGLAVDTAMSDLWEGIYDAVGQAYTIFFDCVVVADAYIGPEGQNYVSDLSQSISSTWNLLAQTNFRIISTQSVTTTWNTLTKWDAISDLSQFLSTSWIIDVVLTLAGGINYIVDLSQTITTSFLILIQWDALTNLSQAISTSWIISLQTTFNIVIPQTLTTTWAIITQTAFNIEPSLSLTTTWIVDIIQGFQYTIDLTLGITFTWAIDIVYTIGEAATGIGIAFLALILALTAIAIGLLYSKR